MADPGIGRVLVASLHEGIADVLPMRLGFYESWLNAEALRSGTIGVAPVLAVLSFLRQEGDAYDRITTRAGEYAAEWTIETMPAFRRSLIRRAPPWLRSRMLVREARRLVRDTYATSRATGRVRRGAARLDLHASIFCSVREPVGHPLCGFYASAFTRLMSHFGLESTAVIVACRGVGASACVLSIPFTVDAVAAVREASAG